MSLFWGTYRRACFKAANPDETRLHRLSTCSSQPKRWSIITPRDFVDWTLDIGSPPVFTVSVLLAPILARLKSDAKYKYSVLRTFRLSWLASNQFRMLFKSWLTSLCRHVIDLQEVVMLVSSVKIRAVQNLRHAGRSLI